MKIQVFAILLFHLATIANAQFNCPAGSSVCTCRTQSNGLVLTCNGNQTPEYIRGQIQFYKPYGPIASLSITGITQSVFSYVPDDFLVGNLIQSVSFSCYHSRSVNNGHLTFSAYAFFDSSGVCGLTGNLTISDCNIRQFYAGDLKNCNQLEKLAFMDSHVDNIIEIPTLESLKNFTVYYPRIWTGATQRGLSRFSLASGASLPRLLYLDLTGNSLTDDSIGFIPLLTTAEEIHLETNFLNTIPVLTGLTNLHTFSSTLNASITEVSIHLPNPRLTPRSVTTKLYSSVSTKIYNVVSLQGSFASNDSIYLNIGMNEFNQDIFLTPLESGLKVYLNPASKIQCACKISWLVRDYPNLLSQVYNGTCSDGRPFESINVEEVVCCPTQSLIKRVGLLQEENYNLKSTVEELRSVIESSRNARRSSEF